MVGQDVHPGRRGFVALGVGPANGDRAVRVERFDQLRVVLEPVLNALAGGLVHDVPHSDGRISVRGLDQRPHVCVTLIAKGRVLHAFVARISHPVVEVLVARARIPKAGIPEYGHDGQAVPTGKPEKVLELGDETLLLDVVHDPGQPDADIVGSDALDVTQFPVDPLGVVQAPHSNIRWSVAGDVVQSPEVAVVRLELLQRGRHDGFPGGGVAAAGNQD